jgi:hypothetical protein
MHAEGACEGRLDDGSLGSMDRASDFFGPSGSPWTSMLCTTARCTRRVRTGHGSTVQRPVGTSTLGTLPQRSGAIRRTMVHSFPPAGAGVVPDPKAVEGDDLAHRNTRRHTVFTGVSLFMCIKLRAARSRAASTSRARWLSGNGLLSTGTRPGFCVCRPDRPATGESAGL